MVGQNLPRLLDRFDEISGVRVQTPACGCLINEWKLMLADHVGYVLAPMSANPFLLLALQISNDGFVYSNSKTMMLYDGACQTCESQESGLCTLKVCASLLSIMKICIF